MRDQLWLVLSSGKVAASQQLILNGWLRRYFLVRLLSVLHQGLPRGKHADEKEDNEEKRRSADAREEARINNEWALVATAGNAIDGKRLTVATEWDSATKLFIIAVHYGA